MSRRYSGAAHLLIVGLLVVLAAGGFLAYRINQAQIEVVDDQGTGATDKLFTKTKAAYINTELGVRFDYPISWGEVKSTEGKVEDYEQADFTQLTFSKGKNVTVNLVLGRYASPFDGCPSNDVVFAHEHLRRQASTLGWRDDNVLTLEREYGGDRTFIRGEASRFTIDGQPQTNWNKQSVSGDVLEYKPEVPLSSTEEGGCGEPMTEAQVKKANSFRNFYYYLNKTDESLIGAGVDLEFETRDIYLPSASLNDRKVKGVNATYDANDGVNGEIRTQLIDLMKSVKLSK